MKTLLLIILALVAVFSLRAEQYGFDLESAALKRSIDSIEAQSPSKFRMAQLVSPASPLVIGSLALYASKVEDIDMSWSDRISSGHGTLRFDDYLQYSPVVVMWGLDAFAKIKPRHKIKQQSTILLMSALASLTLVQVTKEYVARHRPDTGAPNSFPSGHTATAFLCAEMLHHEFGHHSPWISVAGYSLATVTGFMRVYNERHYICDVLAGAGIGMLSARLAYWAAPSVNKLLWGSETGYKSVNYTAMIAPCAVGDGVGVGLYINF